MEKYVVVTKAEFDQSLREKVMELSKITMDIYRKQPGLISARFQYNENQAEYIYEWNDPESHKASWRNPEFMQSNVIWQELLKTGKLKYELHTYQVPQNKVAC